MSQLFSLLDSGIVVTMGPCGFIPVRLSILLLDLVTTIPLFKILMGKWFWSFCLGTVTCLRWIMVGWLVGFLQVTVSVLRTFPSGEVICLYSDIRLSIQVRKPFPVPSLDFLLAFLQLFCSCQLFWSLFVQFYCSQFVQWFCSHLVCMCVNRPLVRTVYPNHEVVVFQPWEVIATHLGSVAIVNNFYSRPWCLTCLNHFYIFLDYPILPPPPHQQPFIVVTPLHSNSSPPHLPERNAIHLDVAHTCHPQASAARLCTPRRVPASASVSHVNSPPPFPPYVFNFLFGVPFIPAKMNRNYANWQEFLFF